MRYLVTNFAYGTGPYLRTTELAIALNREREAAGAPRLGIIVPWVYGERQKRVMLEEFGGYERAYPGEILLDAKLGELLGKVFYDRRGYEEALRQWVYGFEGVSRAAHEHLSGAIGVETLSGAAARIEPDIALELARAPRIRCAAAPVYSVTFGYISEILERALEAGTDAIAADRALIAQAVPIARAIESEFRFQGLAEPGTFSYLSDRQRRSPAETPIPPTIPAVLPNHGEIREGIYVTVTGIPGLERLYAEAKDLGLKLYSNDPIAVPGSERLLPHAIPNPAIKLQFARSGWGSIWLSMLSATPFVAPEFDPADDPEIYFNNRCIEELGLGIVYRGQPLGEILGEAERLRPGIRALTHKLLERFGTLDGNAYAASRIAADFSKF